MPSLRRPRALLPFTLALALAACGSSKETTKDAAVESKPEVGPDVAPEVSPEVAPEVGPDVSAEAGLEVGPDASAEAGLEVGPDASAEAGLEVGPEAPTDAGPEVDPACATIPHDATRTVHLRITADNECEVFVNGADVGNTTSWPSPVTLDVSLYLYPGRINVIAVMGRNTSSQAGNDRGIIGELDDLTDGGSKVVLVTDKTWRSSKIERSGWPATLYDDSGWDQATEVANHGDPPWGALLGTSNAKWLWTAPVPADVPPAKPDQETGFFRKAFYFGTDGTTLTDKPACPPVGP